MYENKKSLEESQKQILNATEDDYMNEFQMNFFKEKLQAWKNELLQEASKTVSNLQEEPGYMPDQNDRASLEEEFSLELKKRDRDRKLLIKINKSLDSIYEDDYGYCTTCGDSIGVRRLLVRPTATQCFDCKSLDEIKEKHIRKS
jgi:DnaK suppressor protein